MPRSEYHIIILCIRNHKKRLLDAPTACLGSTVCVSPLVTRETRVRFPTEEVCHLLPAIVYLYIGFLNPPTECINHLCIFEPCYQNIMPIIHVCLKINIFHFHLFSLGVFISLAGGKTGIL